MVGDFESHVDILDTATAERIAEAIRNGAGRVEILEPGQRQPLTEPRPEAMADRRQGVSIIRSDTPEHTAGLTQAGRDAIQAHKDVLALLGICGDLYMPRQAAEAVERIAARYADPVEETPEAPPTLEEVVNAALRMSDWACIRRLMPDIVALRRAQRHEILNHCALAMKADFPWGELQAAIEAQKAVGAHA
jgi:hypothetical protein